MKARCRERQDNLDARAREAVDPRTRQRKGNHRSEGNRGLKAGLVLKGLRGSTLGPCMQRCSAMAAVRGVDEPGHVDWGALSQSREGSVSVSSQWSDAA